MSHRVYKDSECRMEISGDVDPYKTPFKTLRASAQNDCIYYKTSTEDSTCHKMTFSGVGFHLAHEDIFHECEREDHTIVACMVGKVTADVANARKESGGDALHFYESVTATQK